MTTFRRSGRRMLVKRQVSSFAATRTVHCNTDDGIASIAIVYQICCRSRNMGSAEFRRKTTQRSSAGTRRAGYR